MLRIYRFFDLLNPRDPFELVETGRLQELERRLNHGLSPNERSTNDYTLLAMAIDRNQPRIIVLLLRYGADPNAVMHHADSEERAIDDIFYSPGRHGKALLRLLLTYRVDYEHFRGIAARHGATRFHMREKIDWMDREREACYRIVERREEAERLFHRHEYAMARIQFELAATELRRAAERDRSDCLTGDSTYRDHSAYYEDYIRRAEYCQNRADECERCIAEGISVSERDPLLTEAKKNV